MPNRFDRFLAKLANWATYSLFAVSECGPRLFAICSAIAIVSLLLTVFVLLELLPSHRKRHACHHHESLNQTVEVVLFVSLLLLSVLVPLLVVGVGVRCLTKLRHNVQTVLVVFLDA